MEILARADKIYTAGQVEKVYDRLAEDISDRLKDADPVVLAVMNGGLIPAAALLVRFSFALEVAYTHPTRYRDQTQGGDLEWRVPIPSIVTGRSVLVIDDILDEGVTLQGVVERCQELGAEDVLVAVLIRKRHDRCVWPHADFVGLEVEDRYVFGSGMDYCGYLRNAQGVYALAEEDI